MTVRLSSLLGFLAGAALVAVASARADSETLRIYGDNEVSIAVPDGWKYSAGPDSMGIISARIANPDERVVLQVSFFPDAGSKMMSEEAQTRAAGEICDQYLDGSVEKQARLQPLRPLRGSGLYCVFTDATLVGKKDVPANDYLNATTGVKAVTGWFAVFTLLSNDTDSSDYRLALGLLRRSIQPAAGTYKPKRDPYAF